MDFERDTNHHRSFFDESLNWLPFSVKYPTFVQKMSPLKNFDEMLTIAEAISSPFCYSRIDLYNLDGMVFFGEVTFAPGSGLETFSDKSYDYWLGAQW